MKSLYFSHDYNASEDVKMLFMRQQLGMEGVGIYWYIIERLAQAGGKMPLKIIPVLAMQMQVPEIKVSAVINHFELFNIDDIHFFSQRLLKTLELTHDVRIRQSEAGKKAMAKRYSTPTTKQMIL